MLMVISRFADTSHVRLGSVTPSRGQNGQVHAQRHRVKRNMPRKWQYQQDNEPKHISPCYGIRIAAQRKEFGL
jgi:hypothetical protein